MRAASRRALRTAAGLLVGVLLLVVVAAGGLWLWSGTEGSLAWALQRVSRALPGFAAEGVTGSLRTGLRVQRLAFEQQGLQVEAREVHLEWHAPALVTRTVQLDELQAASVRVTDRRPASGEPLRLPEALDLPLRVVLERLAVAEISYQGAAASFDARTLAGGYAFDGLGHQLRLDRLAFANGVYRGRASLGARGDHALAATVQGTVTAAVPGGTRTVPVAFNAELRGPLADLRADARLGTGSVDEGPRATVTARVTPFEAQPLPEAHALLARLDLGAFWPQAPRTALSGRVDVAPQGTGSWNIEADLANALAGPWDKERLPLQSLKADAQWRGGAVLVREALLRAGGGAVRVKGRWQGAAGWNADATVDAVDPAALHSQLAPQPVAGTLQARQEGEAIAFDVKLAADGRPRGRNRSDAAAAVAALELREALAQGRWAGGTLTLSTLRVRASDALLEGAGTLRPQGRAASGRFQLQAPGLQARVDGEISAARGGGQLQVEARDLAQTQRWLRRVPGLPAALREQRLAGRALLDARWRGGWNDPSLNAVLTAPSLEWGDPAWLLRDARATVDGRMADARIALQAQAQQGQRRLALDMAGRGGKSGAGWRAAVEQLRLALNDPQVARGAAMRLELRKPFEAVWSGGQLGVGAGEAALSAPAGTGTQAAAPALLAWSPIRWGGGELQTAGRLTGLPLAWVELFGGPQLAGSAFSGDMVFDAQWNAVIGRGVRIDAGLARVRGDVTVLAETLDGASQRLPAGVKDARLTLAARDSEVTLTARWDSERAGTADARLATRLVPGGAAGWTWAEDAPLAGNVRAQLPRIGVWSLLAPPGWRLRGSLSADVAIAGTRAAPSLNGTLAADDLALRSVVDGVELQGGRLRARLAGDRLVVDEFLLHGGSEAAGGAGGTLTATGEGRWTSQGPQLQASARLRQLRASLRSDRQLTVSGELSAEVTPQGTQVKGSITVDRALIVIPDETAPRLGEDVVVRNAPGQIATAEERSRKPPPEPRRERAPFNLEVALDLGPDFRVRGRGIDTRLAGDLQVQGRSLALPAIVGTIRTVGGQYRAYNQRLDIERGILRFTGPVDDPALDILAVRPQTSIKVGVMVTGRAQSPFVRLYSEPDLPDAEKLSWLVLGREAPAGGAESALVQQAALALLASRRGSSGGPGIAGRFGLDQLSVRRDSGAGAVVTLGKRFAANFYASYERSLSGAMGTLFVFYDVSRRFTVRGQAGERAAVDLIYTFAFD